MKTRMLKTLKDSWQRYDTADLGKTCEVVGLSEELAKKTLSYAVDKQNNPVAGFLTQAPGEQELPLWIVVPVTHIDGELREEPWRAVIEIREEDAFYLVNDETSARLRNTLSPAWHRLTIRYFSGRGFLGTVGHRKAMGDFHYEAELCRAACPELDLDDLIGLIEHLDEILYGGQE